MNRPSSVRGRLFRGLTLLVALAACLGLVELGLRAAGFRYELRVTVLESTAPDASRVYDHYRIDRDLTWVPRDYEERLERARAARLVFLGDSCTEYGAYPSGLIQLLERRAGREIPYANLAVAGWTSHQGLRQIERDLAGTTPAIVTLFYGWNDHWMSMGLDDRSIERLNRSPLFGWQGTRIGQLATRGWVGLTTRGREPVPRVQLDAFRENLTAAVRAVKELGALPVLITAPSSHERGREPAYLAERWMPQLEELVPTHRRYVEAVREVARAEQAALVDLARSFDALPPAVRRSAFMEDGIHFNREGDRRVALMLLDAFERNGWDVAYLQR